MAIHNESVASNHGMPIFSGSEAGEMKILIGTSNLDKDGARDEVSVMRERLTQALHKRQEKETLASEAFDLVEALRRAQEKNASQKPASRSASRHDPLAEAKAAATMRGVKTCEEASETDSEQEPSTGRRAEWRRTRPGTRHSVRRDLLAEAKAAAALKEWKAHRENCA